MSAMTTRTRQLILHTTLLWACVGFAAGADEAGRKIYVDQCASCHGDQGQGVRDRSTRIRWSATVRWPR